LSISDFDQCLAAAQNGDDASFVVLFRSCQPALLRYLRTIDTRIADDVAADTWVDVVRNLQRFTGDEQGWRAWVFTIARARLRDEQRRASRRPTPVDAREALGALADPVDVSEAVETVLSTEAALALVARLPRDQAEAVLLRHVAGLDVAHAASVLGKKPGSVRVATHRGLRRLADMVGVQRCNASEARIDR
jgi:RNA polymerase sigma-70 factor (ECF subfamily)